MEAEHLTAFENVRGQIGCCGIWCGSCVVGNESLRELTAKYEEVLRSDGLEHRAPEDLDYGEFARSLSLGVVRRVASCAGCRKGGGRDDCELRSCCGSEGVRDCLECSKRSRCDHGGVLKHMRSGARAANLFVKDASGADEQLLEEWEALLRTRWPSSVLFMEED